MKYASLDIETTGLDKDKCQVLQIAVVVDDMVSSVEELPRFVAFIDHDNLCFEPYALGLHAKTGLIQRYLADKEKKSFDNVIAMLLHFMDRHYPLAGKEKYNLAGKNLQGFDIPFLRSAYRFDPRHIFIDGAKGWAGSNIDQLLNRVSHRVIDPGTTFTDFILDTGVPSLDVCKVRAGITNQPVTHDALDDALDVVRVVRHIAAIT